MKKYFYFGVLRLKEVTTANNQVSKSQYVAWGKPYASAQEALAANANWVCKHLGERFIVQGFERQLDVQADGSATGFKGE